MNSENNFNVQGNSGSLNNQNNNIYTNQNINQQTFNNQTQNYQNVTRQLKRNNKKFIIITLLIIVSMAAIILFINNKDKKDISSDTPNITYDENGDFLLAVEDVFSITGRGTVVTGRVARGKIKVGDYVQIIGLDNQILTKEIVEIEMFRQQLEEAVIGDNVGIYLKDTTREEVKRGQVLAKPNSISAAKKFDAEVYVLTKEEGGRSTPFFDGYKAQFYFRTIDIDGVVDLPNNINKVNPGDKVSFTTSLTTSVAMEVGTEFTIRENNKTIAKGIVTKVY